jgi:hypothetical protein
MAHLLKKVAVNASRMMSHPDRLSGVLLSLVACVAIFEAFQLPFGSVRAPDSGFFPLSLSILLLIFALGIVLNSFLTKSEPPKFAVRSWNIVIGALAFIVYAISMPKVGFVLTTLVVMLLFMIGFGRMDWRRASLIAFPSVLLSYLFFVQLGVPLPRGPLPF